MSDRSLKMLDCVYEWSLEGGTHATVAVHCAEGPLIVGTAVAQAQKRTPPEIGLLSSRSAGESASLIAAFHDGLKESGYVEGIGPKRRSRDVC